MILKNPSKHNYSHSGACTHVVGVARERSRTHMKGMRVSQKLQLGASVLPGGGAWAEGLSLQTELSPLKITTTRIKENPKHYQKEIKWWPKNQTSIRFLIGNFGCKEIKSLSSVIFYLDSKTKLLAMNQWSIHKSIANLGYTHTFMCVHMCTCVWIHMCVNPHACVEIQVYSSWVCVFICIVSIHNTHTHVCVCVYTANKQLFGNVHFWWSLPLCHGTNVSYLVQE